MTVYVLVRDSDVEVYLGVFRTEEEALEYMKRLGYSSSRHSIIEEEI